MRPGKPENLVKRFFPNKSDEIKKAITKIESSTKPIDTRVLPSRRDPDRGGWCQILSSSLAQELNSHRIRAKVCSTTDIAIFMGVDLSEFPSHCFVIVAGKFLIDLSISQFYANRVHPPPLVDLLLKQGFFSLSDNTFYEYLNFLHGDNFPMLQNQPHLLKGFWKKRLHDLY